MMGFVIMPALVSLKPITSQVFTYSHSPHKNAEALLASPRKLERHQSLT
jgi:predicted ATP-dependent endonuclease of OLD family